MPEFQGNIRPGPAVPNQFANDLRGLARAGYRLQELSGGIVNVFNVVSATVSLAVTPTAEGRAIIQDRIWEEEVELAGHFIALVGSFGGRPLVSALLQQDDVVEGEPLPPLVEVDVPPMWERDP